MPTATIAREATSDSLFSAVMGAGRGLDGAASLDRLDTDADRLMDDFFAGEPGGLYSALAAHRQHPDHPAVQKLLEVACDDLAEEAEAMWADDVRRQTLRPALRLAFGSDIGASPWLLLQSVKVGQRVGRTVHIADLRPGARPSQRTSGNPPMPLCGSEMPLSTSAWSAAKRGMWRAPSRMSARRCSACQRAAETMNLAARIPALKEKSDWLPSLSWRQSVRMDLAAVAADNLLSGGLSATQDALNRAARGHVLALLADACAADPFAALWHIAGPGACPANLTAGSLADAAATLAQVDWNALWDAYLPQRPKLFSNGQRRAAAQEVCDNLLGQLAAHA